MSNTSINPNVLLSTVEAAKYLGLKPQTLRKKRLDGTGPPYIRLGDSKFARAAYRRSDLEGWLREKTFRSTSQETIGTHRVAGIDPDP